MPRAGRDGSTLYYEEAGHGTPVVFLAGLGGDHRAFGATLRHMSDRYRTIGLDNRDVGRSDRATAPYSTSDMARDVLAWMDAIDLPSAHFVGQSLGGLIAQEVALAEPRRVLGLVLASTHAGADPWRRAVIDSWISTRKLLADDIGAFTRSTLPWLVAPPFYHQAPQIEGLVRFAERNEYPQAPPAFERQAMAAAHHDTRDRLRDLWAPTLVLVGELDAVNPPRVAAELADGIPNSRLEILPGVGHLPHIEGGSAFRESLDRFFATLD